VGDIEKLLKKKLEIEPFEIEDDRPRRPRRFDADDSPRAAEVASEAPRAPVRERATEVPRRSLSPARDPFFDKPYEPASSDAAPAWESAPRAAMPVPARMGLSPSIRPKKKVAMLLGGG